MPIRLLALDLDGTLLNSRGEVSTGNLHAIQEARSLGVNVAIVTGRRFRDAQPLALELGLDVPVISHNGALTKHARTLETVSALLLPVDAALSVIEIGRRQGADALLSDDAHGPGLLLYEHISPENHGLAKYIAWSKRIVGDQAVETVRHVPSLSEYVRHEPIHISFSGRCEAMASLAQALRDELGGRVQVLCTIYRQQDFTLVDVLNPAASKGAGVAAVAAEMGITSDEVMAMGDNHNDLEMLEYAGTPVVMSNAEPALRERSDFELTSSNDEDGVALAIERFILGVSAGGL
jgi:Cof subfamily protein (haloacid dehalogenase superfamily)